MDELYHTQALEQFSYDRKTGVLTHRKVTTNRVKVGAAVGRISATGYLVTRFQGMTTKVHRLIWLWVTGAWPDGDVDHIDGNRTNNAWSNLRVCSRAQNLHNMRAKNPKSGFKGVVKRGGSFMARVRAQGKAHYIGSFKSAEEAARAYDDAARRLQGEFARTNQALGLLSQGSHEHG